MGIMDKQILRFILLSTVVFVGFSLFTKYSAQDINTARQLHGQDVPVSIQDVPVVEPEPQNDLPNETLLPIASKKDAMQRAVDVGIVTVETDVLKVSINSHGDLVFAELKKYPQNNSDPNQGFALLTEANNRFYIAQSGLLSDMGPDSKIYGRAKLVAAKPHYFLRDNDQKVEVDLFDPNPADKQAGINCVKRLIFYRNSYKVEVQYIVTNNSNVDYTGSMYGRLRRNQEKSKGGFLGGGLKTYSGAAIHTPDEKYKKIPFSDMKTPYKIAFNGGWIAMIEHYFVSSWIPDNNVFTEYQTEQFNDNSFGIRFVNAPILVSPGTTKIFKAQLFVGPKITEILKTVSPALELTVDYGVLWWLCVPLFALLQAIFNLIGNWGWAIIMTTLVIKLLFYKLSASSYRSMGNLRKLQPKIESLKASCGDDKQKFSQSVMELYRKEKVNPLGGCLPIVVQIPVFIALYYVLLESVELRQAHWCMWVTDLSSKDPFYILPIIMGISMFMQQKMNPPPADPMQAKVLMVMPAFFTVLFLQFPSGLMLYWVVNNSLSILQQVFITRSIDKQITTNRSW